MLAREKFETPKQWIRLGTVGFSTQGRTLPTRVANLYEFACHSSHNADDNFLA